MKRGRKPTPDELKRLAGNPGKRPLNDDAPKPVAEAPPLPSYVEKNPLAKAAWEALVDELRATHLLARCDAALYMIFAVTMADFADVREARNLYREKASPALARGQLLKAPNQTTTTRKYDKDGKVTQETVTEKPGGLCTHPLANREPSLIKTLLAVCSELGLSPTSRTRLRVPQRAEEEEAYLGVIG